MNIQQRPVAEIVADAIRILTQEIGPADTARFIAHFSTGYGNYTEERERLLADYSVDDVVDEILAAKKVPEPKG